MKQSILKRVFSFIAVATICIILWIMSAREESTSLQTWVASSLMVLTAILSYRLYRASIGKRTEIVIAAIAFNVLITGFCIIVPMTLIAGLCTPMSSRTLGVILFLAGLIPFYAISNANIKEVNRLMLQMLGLKEL